MAEHTPLEDSELLEVEEEELSSSDELEPAERFTGSVDASAGSPKRPRVVPPSPSADSNSESSPDRGEKTRRERHSPFPLEGSPYHSKSNQMHIGTPDDHEPSHQPQQRSLPRTRDSDSNEDYSDDNEDAVEVDSSEHDDGDPVDNAAFSAEEVEDVEEEFNGGNDRYDEDADDVDPDDDDDDRDSDPEIARSEETDGAMNDKEIDKECEDDAERSEGATNGALAKNHRGIDNNNDDDDSNNDEDDNDDDDDDDDDDDSLERDQVVSRRRRRTAPLVIPDDLREDGAYFRRSSRQRHSVSRYTGDDSSEAAAENDSDFDILDNHDDDNDEKEGGDDTEYMGGSKKTSRRARTRPRRKTNALRYEHEAAPVHDEVAAASDSDGDWNTSKDKRRAQSRRRLKRPKVAARPSSDDDDVARTARINMRTGGAVNYAEVADSDSDIFDDEDAAANRAAKLETGITDDNDEEGIALVCDFRPYSAELGAEASVSKTTSPFESFDPTSVEFNIHWTGKSFRRNTWHKLEDLRAFKGFKKVTNYVKVVLARREELRQPPVSSEELEEAAILFVENRDALAHYTIIDRIVAERESDDGADSLEYLVKWENLPYRDCTWEPATELQSSVDMKAIDAYNDRIQVSLTNSSGAGKNRRLNPFGKDARPKFRRMAKQPSFLHGEGRTLREYQLAGLNWLAFSWSNNRNVILADEMGLGKTLQTISFLGWIMYERHVPGPFLVVVPLSTIAAWVREFIRWLPEMNVVCYTGDASSRRMIRQYEFDPLRGSKWKGTGVKFHVLLTTPELAMMDMAHLEPIRWAMIAVDEAHRLKNKDSELHRSLAGLSSANRLLVTGTPLQNSVAELWALLHFLNPDQFDDPVAFEDSFSFAALRDEERVAELHSTLRPYIIRRQKIDVEKSLPKKTYNVLRVGMTTSQQQLYRWLLTKNFAKLNAGTRGKGMGPKTTLRNLIMELKKCCNHPFLFENVEDITVKTTVETLIRASGKMILLDKLLLRLREKGHRVLVFSQMVRMLDILSDYCRMRGFPFQRLDGSMPNDLRVRAVDHYNAPGSTDYVFLLSTRAGGLGINLATADTVIIFDSDWNPQNDLQAESRAHRIGQTKDVKVFRLLSRETVEEDILERAKRKRVLEHLVIHGVEGDEQDKDGKNKFNKQELKAILRFGAEKLFKETGPTPDDGLVGSSMNGGNATGAPGLSPAEDAKGEEGRVLEVDDIDELLSRTPAEPEDELGAAEPTMGDSLLNAFKWADFDPIDDDEKPEEESEDSNRPGASGEEERQVMAKNAARGIGAKEDRRIRDIARAKAQQEIEDRNLAEDDSEYWGRVIPDDLKDRAVNEVVEEDMVLGTRKRKQTRTYGAESPTAKRLKRNSRGSKHSDALHGELSRKEERMVVRSWKRFWDPSRARDILRDAGVSDRLEEQTARDLLVEALAKSRDVVREAERNPVPLPAPSVETGSADGGSRRGDGEDPAEQKSNGKRAKTDVKLRGPPAIMIDVLGEQVNARDVIKRCSEMELLGRLVSQTKNSETQFRLRVHLKAPAYGISWKPKNDAMLLLGVYRHGFGNWSRIAADDDLQLNGKMNLDGSESNKGAPDPTKLTRRVNALLRELCNEEQLSSAKKSKKNKALKGGAKMSKSIGSNGHSSKRHRSELQDGDSSAKHARAKGKSIEHKKPGTVKRTIMTDALLATHKETLRDLRRLSREDARISNKELIERMKICLLHLGAQIVKLSQQRERVRNELWEYVHHTCRTKHPGDRLSALYEKLAETERRRHDGGSRSH